MNTANAAKNADPAKGNMRKHARASARRHLTSFERRFAEDSSSDSDYLLMGDRPEDSVVREYVAIDCEMVGVGKRGMKDMLARVSVVNQKGDVLLDKYVKPQQNVVDYRTRVSGVRPADMANGVHFAQVQKEVKSILEDKILVGHSVQRDLLVLCTHHPLAQIRDTAYYKPFYKILRIKQTPSLKALTKAILGRDIQTGEHNSVEDARAAMGIYNRYSKDWESELLVERRNIRYYPK